MQATGGGYVFPWDHSTSSGLAPESYELALRTLRGEWQKGGERVIGSRKTRRLAGPGGRRRAAGRGIPVPAIVTVDAGSLWAYSARGGLTRLVHFADRETWGLMMTTLDDVLTAARTLSATDRLRLVDALWEDVPPAEWPAPNDEWIAEAQRRSVEHDAGRTSSSTWSEVQARARRKAGLDG